ncbi:hypothetical protein STEPF1_05077 [Streptomyces sp. F-1]|nr:hypothetical protein STEPF1_05077 [Streptomyces sp. F-1]
MVSRVGALRRPRAPAAGAAGACRARVGKGQPVKAETPAGVPQPVGPS